MKESRRVAQQFSKKTLSVAIIVAACGLPSVGFSAESLTAALTEGTASMDVRLRYETAEQDNALKDATANTVRTRLGYTTGDFKGWSAFVEMENVSVLGDEDYDSKVNGNTTYSVIADPDGSEVNRVSLSYKGANDSVVTWGRQRLIFDNARFIGNVGWRQNEQTFDALVLTNGALEDTKASYAYVYNVNGITGGDTDAEAHLLNVAYSGLSAGKLTGYGYWLDFVDAPTTSQQTIGVHFSGNHMLNELTKLLYDVEYATQQDYQSGAASIDADYIMGMLGVTASGITAKLGYEVLGGDGTTGFSTPLATKHAFNGWADNFLATPADGLTDISVAVSTKVSGTKLMAVYHDFSSDEGSTDYGTEVDLLVAKNLSKQTSVLLKYASYSADNLKVDTDKLWLQGQFKF